MHFFRLLHNDSEVFRASPGRLREQERYEAFGFASKIVALQVHRTLWYISLRCHYHHGRRRYLPNSQYARLKSDLPAWYILQINIRRKKKLKENFAKYFKIADKEQ